MMKKTCLLFLTTIQLHSTELYSNKQQAIVPIDTEQGLDKKSDEKPPQEKVNSSFCLSKKLEKDALTQIGMKVWHNECRGTVDGLVSWNEGEDFPSLGIGHFIWHPEGGQKHFEETFPLLIEFFKENEVHVPSWIDSKKGCPWKNREALNKAKRGKKVRELRELLSTTLDLQILFIYEQFQRAEKKLLPLLGEKEISYLEKLKETPQGIYALIDYVHFKGTGLSPKERYRGEGWGLLQVLQTIGKSYEEGSPITLFVSSAKKVLAKRVKNAPRNRNEERWINGWFKRVETYELIPLLPGTAT